MYRKRLVCYFKEGKKCSSICILLISDDGSDERSENQCSTSEQLIDSDVSPFVRPSRWIFQHDSLHPRWRSIFSCLRCSTHVHLGWPVVVIILHAALKKFTLEPNRNCKVVIFMAGSSSGGGESCFSADIRTKTKLLSLFFLSARLCSR